MLDWIREPWPWWVSGILVGLIVPLMKVLAAKDFGISTSFQELGAICSPSSRLAYFAKFDKRANLWTLVFVAGLAAGGWLASHWLSAQPIEFLPNSFQGTSGAIKLLVGGFLIGFGARYAGGCTSGHSITGIANLNMPSLIATICFFAGGLGVTWGLGRWLF